jgi:anti-sigma regulatory factor (Ser/Thr protein kinase)
VTGDRSLVLRPELAELARLRAWADEFIASLALPDEIAFRVQLCLEEAVSNIIRHGTGAEREIAVMLRASGSAILAMTEDQGQPFDPSQAPARSPPSSLEDASAGGFGLLLMRRFADGMSYERVGARNRLVFTFEPRRAAL